jgi:hypothetical protein
MSGHITVQGGALWAGSGFAGPAQLINPLAKRRSVFQVNYSYADIGTQLQNRLRSP